MCIKRSCKILQKFYIGFFAKSLQLALLCGKITDGGCTDDVNEIGNSLNTRRHSDDAGGCAALTAVISAEYVGHASPAEEDLQKT